MITETINQTDKYIKSTVLLELVKRTYKHYLSNPDSLYSDFISVELCKNPDLKKLINNIPVYTKYNYGRISTSLRYKAHCLLLRADSPKCTIEQESTFYIFVYPNGYHGTNSKVQFFSITKG